MKITTQEEQLAQLRASSEAERRLLEDTIRALRENLEVATADTAQNLENLRLLMMATKVRPKEIYKQLERLWSSFVMIMKRN